MARAVSRPVAPHRPCAARLPARRALDAVLEERLLDRRPGSQVDRERDAVIKDGLASGKKLGKDDNIQRYKGLGEMNAEELWETTMDPANRILRQVTMDDAATADELFSVLMGEDVEARRSFITRNAKSIKFLDI